MSEYRRTIKYNIKHETNEQRLARLLIPYFDDIAKEINEKLAKIQYDKAIEISKSAIDNFYKEYKPHLYDRTYDLYNIFDIQIIDGGQQFQFAFDTDLMGWHRSNDAVYELDFKQGYHGGKRWRNPPRPGVTVFDPDSGENVFATHSWEFWHPQKVERSTPPFNNIVSRWNFFLDNKFEKIQDQVVEDVLQKYVQKVW